MIERSLARGYRPGMVLIDAGYGNNTTFLKQLEEKKLKYLGGVAKNRKVIITNGLGDELEIRLDGLGKSMPEKSFEPIILNLEKPKTVWVATVTAKISRLEGERTFAIVMNARSFNEATDIDYFITNVEANKIISEWIVNSYSQRNWVEVF